MSVTFAGIDKLLAQHIAHLFIRDPISLFSELVDQDDNNQTDHFEVSCARFRLEVALHMTGEVRRFLRLSSLL